MSANIKRFILSILFCQVAGILGSFFTDQTVFSWYLTLKKPSFTPPGWLLGTIWITLYLVMGVSLYLIWNSDAPVEKKRPAMLLFFIHLLFNAAWSFFFFFLQNPLAGFLEIIVLWSLILVVFVLFYRLRRLAALLFIPYLLWVTFAGVLNYVIWNMNR